MAKSEGVDAALFDRVVEMRFGADGVAEIVLDSGVRLGGRITARPNAEPTAIASSALFPKRYELLLTTSVGDEIRVELPRPDDVAPVRERPTVYLDQNHVSTLSKSLYEPGRVAATEREAALQLIDMVSAGDVLLPMSAGHAAETAQDKNPVARYQRALTLAQLSAGWQLLDPLTVRRLELGSALARRYRQHDTETLPVVTLERRALHADRDTSNGPRSDGLPLDFQWITEAVSSIVAIYETMLAETIRQAPVPGWAKSFQEFAGFLASDPTGREMKQKRTHAKFITDLGNELLQGAVAAGVTGEQMVDWVMEHSETDLIDMPALGVYRWTIHHKLSDPTLRWEQNDLNDMMYLSVGAGYCDHVAGERRHAAFINNALRSLGRSTVVHHKLQTLVAQL